MPDPRFDPSSAPAPSSRSVSATVLAFDFGARRIGVAVGEPELGTTHPIERIEAANDAARFEAIGRLVATWQPGRIVVGLPLEADGRHGESAKRAERFARQLEGRYRIPVSRVDERYSSQEAESRLREAAGARRAAQASRGRELDSYAAQLLLEQWFAQDNAQEIARETEGGRS